MILKTFKREMRPSVGWTILLRGLYNKTLFPEKQTGVKGHVTDPKYSLLTWIQMPYWRHGHSQYPNKCMSRVAVIAGRLLFFVLKH